MHRLNYGLLIFSLATVPFAFTGCSGGDTVAVEYVEGVVTLDGKPVPEATVMFVPVTEGQGTSATGYTDENGVYKLTAVALGEGKQAAAEAGTMPGEYYVGVSKDTSEAVMSEEEAFEKKVKYVAPPPGKGPKIVHVVPVKYNLPEKSGIKVTVQAGENKIPIELKSAG